MPDADDLPTIPLRMEATPEGLALVSDDGTRLPPLDGRQVASLIMLLFAALQASSPNIFAQMMTAIARALTRFGSEVAAFNSVPPGQAH